VLANIQARDRQTGRQTVDTDRHTLGKTCDFKVCRVLSAEVLEIDLELDSLCVIATGYCCGCRNPLHTSLFTKQVAQNNITHKYSKLQKQR